MKKGNNDRIRFAGLGTTLRLYKVGLEISNNISNPTTQIDIANGICRTIDDSDNIDLASGLTIDITVSGDGGLITGSVAALSWYHVLIGKKAGSIVACFSPNNVKPATWDSYRRIGNVKTDASSNISAFAMLNWGFGSSFIQYSVAFLDVYHQNDSSALIPYTATVPQGFIVHPYVTTEGVNDAPSAYSYIDIYSYTNTVRVRSGNNEAGSSINTGFVTTNTNGQLKVTWGGISNRSVFGYTLGYIDTFTD